VGTGVVGEDVRQKKTTLARRQHDSPLADPELEAAEKPDLETDRTHVIAAKAGRGDSNSMVSLRFSPTLCCIGGYAGVCCVTLRRPFANGRSG
jgi:hypothetical protein